MIMFTMMAPRRKLKRALQAGGLVLLLAAVVPAIYSGLTEAEAMSSFAEGGATDGVTDIVTEGVTEDVGVAAVEQSADMPEDAANAAEGGEAAQGENSLLRALREAIFGAEQQIEMY